jgi:hypothetical protein
MLRKPLASIILFIMAVCAPGASAQDVLETSSNVINILSEDPVGKSVVFAADLSSQTFKEDVASVSQILLTRGQQKFLLADLGTGVDLAATDGKFTSSFSFGNIITSGTATMTLAEAKAFLTTGPFTFDLLSDFASNPPIPKDLKIQKISPPDDRGNTFKIIANMADAVAILGTRQIFNIKVGSVSARFRDDGLRNDDKSGDLLFTASLKVTDAELKTFIDTNVAAAKMQGAAQTKFVGRSLVSVPVVPLDAAGLQAGRPVAAAALTPFVVNASNLPAIRDKSLMVRDLSVVQDVTRTYDPYPFTGAANPLPRGKEDGCWSFGKLIAGVAGVASPDQALSFTCDWVDTKLFAGASNTSSGDAAAGRTVSKTTFIRAWLRNSGAALPATGFPGDWKSKVKVSRFPVRLLAIVNRLDLRGNLAFGLSNVGEGRFVFCFVDSARNGAFGGSLDGYGSMTIILEYGLPLDNCDKVEAYAKGWFDLRNVAWGAAYNQKLENLTNQFTAQNAAPSKPNQSALNHLRTNDFLQSRKTQGSGHDWEIRDFILSSSGKLDHTWNLADSPEPGFIWNGPRSGTPLLKDLVAHVNALDAKNVFNPPIPSFLKAISAPMDVPNVQGKSNGTIWVGSSLKSETMIPAKRREFSLQSTCSGCHSAETNIKPFTHVRPRAYNTQAILSSFMVGPGSQTGVAGGPFGPISIATSKVMDPVAGASLPSKEFNEAFRRAIDLADLAINFTCDPNPGPTPIINTGTYPPLNNPH